MGVLYGGIEAGGTKFVCAIGTGPENVIAETRFPTTSPAETIRQAIDFMRREGGTDGLAAVGVASFGPVDPDPSSPTFGYITATPKPGWSNTDVAGAIRRELGLEVGFDTDVNGAALAEGRWGRAVGLSDFVYLTIGTGIGGGAMVNGKLLHGLIHPEMGHILLRRDPAIDPFPGSCPFHGDCFEGLASGPAILKRWGRAAERLPMDHPAWQLEAGYLAQALSDIILTLSPQRLILGGGVMERQELFPLVRKCVQELLNGYVRSSQILERIDDYIVPPGLGKRAGVLGAIALAELAAGPQK